MIIIMETMGIHKMRTRSPQSSCLTVHQFNKCVYTARDMFRYRYSRVISGMKQKPAYQVVHCKRISGLESADRFIPVKICGICTDCNLIIHITVFQCNICGQYLCSACRIQPVIKMISVDNRIVFQIKKAGPVQSSIVFKSFQSDSMRTPPVRKYFRLLQRERKIPSETGKYNSFPPSKLVFSRERWYFYIFNEFARPEKTGKRRTKVQRTDGS